MSYFSELFFKGIMQIHAIQPAQPTPLITLKNINVVFEQKTALRDINFSIYPNSIITIVGPNGGENRPF